MPPEPAEAPYPRPPWAQPGSTHRPPRFIAVVFALLIQVPTLVIAGHGHRPVVFGAALIAFASSLLLLVAHRAPGPVLALLALACTPAIAVVPGPPLAAIPLVFAVVIAVRAGTRVWVWSSLAGIALLGGIGWFVVSGDPQASVRVLIVVIALCVVVGVAEAGRTRSDRYRSIAREIAARRQSEAEAERLRIARELHDVLAHSLSQINVQAGVGVHLFDTDPERAKANLRDIKETSSRALDEVRGVLGILRGDGESAARSPEPDLSRLGELTSTASSAGLAVSLENTIALDEPLLVQAALFRIVQEALTNVIRHSTARSISISLSSTADSFRAVITDPGPAVAPLVRNPGRGLVGMRERVLALGGTISASGTPDGGFEVNVLIPRREGTRRMPAAEEPR